MTKQTAHQELLRGVLPRPLSEQEALLWMVFLHTHAIHLRPGVLAPKGIEGQPGEGTVLAPLTQRGAAGVIATLWPERIDPRADHAYWYFQYNTRMPYEDFADLPKELLPPLVALRTALAAEPRVLAVIPDDS